MWLPHRLHGQKVKSQGGAGAYCGGELAAQLVKICNWKVVVTTKIKLFYCCAMLCISAGYAFMRCLYVTFVYFVEMNTHIFRSFSASGSHNSLVFPHRTLWQYSNTCHPNGSVECTWSTNNHNSRSISGFGIDNWWTVINDFDRGVIYSTGRSFITQSATHK